MTFVALNSGSQKSRVTFFEVVNFPAWVYHIVSAVYLFLNVDISLTVTIFELFPLSNIIRKFLKFSLPLRVFMYTCRIGE